MSESDKPIASTKRLLTKATIAVISYIIFFCQLPTVSLDVDGHQHHIVHGIPKQYLPLGGWPPIHVYQPSQGNNRTVAICTVVKNETMYIDEWVDFHIALGFAPIYIYDNMLAPDIELEDWYQKRYDIHGYVRIIHFPHTPVQLAAYDQCIKVDAKDDTFVGLFDVDEFLVLKKHKNVVDFMNEHCKEPICGQLTVNWRMMGVSNQTRYTNVPITKRNVHTDSEAWGTVKTIVRPSYVADNLAWRHTVRLKKGYWLDTRGVIINNTGWKVQANNDGPSDVALFHHYSYKSLEEFHYKNCVRGNSLGKRGENFNLCERDILVEGRIFNDDAWQQLKRMVPEKYSVFDAIQKVSVNATASELRIGGGGEDDERR
eukprot:scaffold3240_cov197-Alexandrium_tamarense.AAC.19